MKLVWHEHQRGRWGADNSNSNSNASGVFLAADCPRDKMVCSCPDWVAVVLFFAVAMLIG